MIPDFSLLLSALNQVIICNFDLTIVWKNKYPVEPGSHFFRGVGVGDLEGSLLPEGLLLLRFISSQIIQCYFWELLFSGGRFFQKFTVY